MNGSRAVTVMLVCLLTGILVAGFGATPCSAQIDAWIDPGHGGKDPGALGIDGAATPNEKDFNLAVSIRVQNILGGYGLFGLLTRNSDIYWTKTRRAQIAAGERANDEGDQEIGLLCASVHMNSVSKPSAFGTKVIFPKEKLYAKSRHAYGPDSSLGSYVHATLLTNAAAAFMGCNQDLGLTRDVRELTVLRKSKIPTVIVECCLISNQCQFNAISTGGSQAFVANGIAGGITNYVATLRPNRPPVASLNARPFGAPYTVVGPPRAGALQVNATALAFPAFP